MTLRRCAAAALALTLPCCVMSSNRLERLAEENQPPPRGRFAHLDSPLFSLRAALTGIWEPERHAHMSEGIYLMEPHRPGRIPVLLVHGLSTGPRAFSSLIRSLDRTRFEPWLAHYATGQSLRSAGDQLRAHIDLAARAHGVTRMAAVSYCLGGLVSRRALRKGAGPLAARVSPLVAVTTPWAGAELPPLAKALIGEAQGVRDLAPGSQFLAHLYSDTLAEQTELHIIYSLRERSSPRIDGEDDGISSKTSLLRAEARSEAETIHLVPHVDHKGIMTDRRAITHIRGALDQAFPRAGRDGQGQPLR